MSALAEMVALATLYRQPSYEMTGCLPDVADRLHTQIHEFLREPCPDKAERLSLELEGNRRHVLRIREALVRQASDPNA